ncbi:outer membrane lipoprotein LolB [Halioglobus maricola]|uniref:Outer-membrane lipoprotein LolB n=1 Tax=Halioglobus maricola TaxID=2601894 RepID=A0A5P9NG76_9GAMM|nr:lipoprotein insertase outer membrane protein LolB [Halioglobus maricola]QFU74810.1 outer membrane lipoprotein LolB [Halioglobus maricola]
MNTFLRISLLGQLLLLAACAGMAPAPPADWQSHRAQLQALDHFSASGKIALRTAEQAESANLLWQQMGKATHLRLQGPMGIAATTVDSDGDVIEVRRGDDYQRWTADTAPQSASWDLPLASLPYWLRGIPDPATAPEELRFTAESELPMSFSQQGWSIQYSSFGEFDGYTLPTRLEVSRADTWARIILRRWQNLAAND